MILLKNTSSFDNIVIINLCTSTLNSTLKITRKDAIRAISQVQVLRSNLKYSKSSIF